MPWLLRKMRMQNMAAWKDAESAGMNGDTVHGFGGRVVEFQGHPAVLFARIYW